MTSPASEHWSVAQTRAKERGEKVCKDCVADPAITNYRPAPHPGPRCTSHHRAKTKDNKVKAHARHVQKTYGLGDQDYGKIYEAQGGYCANCGRATGATRRLSVDHDHKCCAGPVSCGYCVRGLLCRPCNDFLGYVRDDWNAFARGVRYLTGKYASETVLGKRRTK